MQQNISSSSSSSSRRQSNQKTLFEGRWTPQEHIQFLKVFGKDWKKVEDVIQSRTGSQVRSHAQKFFLKICKINKQRRRHKNKPFQLSEAETEILNLFTEQDITDSSPPEIVSIIRKQFNTFPQSILSFISEINKPKSMQHKPNFSENSDEKPEIQEQDSVKPKITQKQEGQFCKILENLKRCEDFKEEDESYFIQLFKRNMEHFKNGGQFSDLIDFGKNVIESQETSPRKFSFMEHNEFDNAAK